MSTIAISSNDTGATYDGDGGAVTASESSEIPAAFPAEVPLPTWNVMSSVDMSSGDVTDVMVSFSTLDGVEAATSQLLELYTGAGFTEVDTHLGGGVGGDIHSLSKEPWNLSVSVAELDGETISSVSLNNDPARAVAPPA